MSAITNHLHQMYRHTPLWVKVLHGQFHEGAEVFSKMLTEKLNVARMERMRISPVLGVHTGPGIVGAAVVSMELMQGFE
jgi:fatty acid kinase fatty acid binding subunit